MYAIWPIWYPYRRTKCVFPNVNCKTVFNAIIKTDGFQRNSTQRSVSDTLRILHSKNVFTFTVFVGFLYGKLKTCTAARTACCSLYGRVGTEQHIWRMIIITELLLQQNIYNLPVDTICCFEIDGVFFFYEEKYQIVDKWVFFFFCRMIIVFETQVRSAVSVKKTTGYCVYVSPSKRRISDWKRVTK